MIAGVDESGRGPLAGPLTIACVWCPGRESSALLRGIRDSKHLTPLAREQWFSYLCNHPRIGVSVTALGHGVIHKHGIGWVLKEGVRRVVRRARHAKMPPTHFYLDGGLRAPADLKQETIIKGDERLGIIGAASIIAKVIHDKKMLRLHVRYPDYGFAVHKGYGTVLHRARILTLGLSPVHRPLFCRKLFHSIKPLRFRNLSLQ